MALFIVERRDTGFTVRPGENTLQAAASALTAAAWAEGTLPGGAGTKSAKEWSEVAAAIAPTLASALDGTPTFDSDALSLTGIASALSWTATTRAIAKAIKFASYTGSAITATEFYYVAAFANADGANGDRIIIKRVSDNTTVADSGTDTINKLADRPTPRVITGTNYRFEIDIDYRDLSGSTGLLLNSATLTPLIFSRGAAQALRAAASRAGAAVRNVAFNPAVLATLTDPTLQPISGTVPAPATANAALTAYGVSRSYAIGTGTTTTGLYKRDALPSFANGKYAFFGALVYSASGSNWPSANLDFVVYSALTGGSPVSGSAETQKDYIQLTANVRLYWARTKLPTSGTIASIAYGFSSLIGGAAGEMSGFMLATDANPLWPENIAAFDWSGYGNSEAWRNETLTSIAAVSTSVSNLAAVAVVNYPYYNQMPNGNLDPVTVAPGWSGTPVYATPAGANIAAKGVKRTIKIGTGGSVCYINEAVLDATASAQYWFASQYVYSADGSTWGSPAAYWYVGLTPVGSSAMTAYVELSANERLYYATGQFPTRSDLTNFRMGPNTNITGSGVNVELGGWTFVRYGSALTLANTPRDEWYACYTRQDTLAKAAVLTGNTVGKLVGKNIVMFGDSIIETYGIPANLATLLQATVYNIGMGGCRMAKLPSPGTQQGYINEMSMIGLATAISTSDYTALDAAAASLAGAPYNDDNRPQIAVLKAIDWATVEAIVIAYGTNDFSASRVLGSATSTTETEFYGALNESIRLLQAKAPAAQIMLCTPAWRGPLADLGDSDLNANSAGLYLKDYADAIRNRCNEKWHVPTCDLDRTLGVNVSNKATYLNTGDDLHPSTGAGSLRWAKRIAARLLAVL